jgi:hypothetical protein
MDEAAKFQNISPQYFATENLMTISFFVALGALAAGLFGIGPLLQNSSGSGAANAFYILLRVLVILGFSFVAVRRYQKNAYQALSLAGLLIFVDQVLLRSIWFVLQFKYNPGEWEGVDLKTAIFNSAFSYLVFLPVVLLLAFIGVSVGTYLNLKRSKSGESNKI